MDKNHNTPKQKPFKEATSSELSETKFIFYSNFTQTTHLFKAVLNLAAHLITGQQTSPNTDA